MSLKFDEISPWKIAYFLHLKLNATARVEHFGTLVTREGPWVCLDEYDGWSLWAEITTQAGEPGSRLPILKKWRQGGKPNSDWYVKSQYLYGTFAFGPNEAFVTAAEKQDTATRSTRPFLKSDGGEELYRQLAAFYPDAAAALKRAGLLD
jgi:hypothetical protein